VSSFSGVRTLQSLPVHARDQVPDGGVLTITESNVRLDETFVAANPSIATGDYIEVAVGGPVAPQEAKRSPALDDLTRADLFMAGAFVSEAGGYLLPSGGSSLRICSVTTIAPRSNPSGKPAILVVEDDAAVRVAWVEALRELDYQVLEAPYAMEAFRLLADQGGIDLLFTDLDLPDGVSGRALADAARNVDPGIRVLCTTGYEHAALPAATAQRCCASQSPPRNWPPRRTKECVKDEA
jgi:CheY-like chemotaxis protein